MSRTIKAFYEISWFDFSRKYSDCIKEEIEIKRKEYILGFDEEEYKNSLFEKYYLEPLEVDYTSEVFGQPNTSKEWIEKWGRIYEIEVYNFTARYIFKGSSILFRVKPETWKMISYEIDVNETNSTVSFNFRVYKKDEKKSSKEKNQSL